MILQFPFSGSYPITQTYAEHVNRARKNGWCSMPGNCPSGVYYYGGVDWGIPVNTPILAAAKGKIVRLALDQTGYGHHVRIEHDGGGLSIYAHLTSYSVKVGQLVVAGELIGRSGNTGNSTGQHLHFEYRINGSPVDPMPLFTAQPALAPAPNPEPVGKFNPGDKVRLKPGNAYVNIRPKPSSVAGVPDLGDLTPGIAVEVVEQTGDWLAVKLYVHAGYVERVS